MATVLNAELTKSRFISCIKAKSVLCFYTGCELQTIVHDDERDVPEILPLLIRPHVCDLIQACVQWI